MEDDIREGDYVRFGTTTSGLTWFVVALKEGTMALLQSGQSGRHRVELIERLRLHTRPA